jgi:hypothetical protein
MARSERLPLSWAFPAETTSRWVREEQATFTIPKDPVRRRASAIGCVCIVTGHRPVADGARLSSQICPAAAHLLVVLFKDVARGKLREDFRRHGVRGWFRTG